jgi:ABC-type branched-subunit amino acid transport system permease subunit
VIIGALAVYFIQLKFVPVILPDIVSTFTTSPAVNDAVHNLNFVIFGLILIGIMLLRPQGLLPSRLRQAELTEGTTDEAVFDSRTA